MTRQLTGEQWSYDEIKQKIIGGNIARLYGIDIENKLKEIENDEIAQRKHEYTVLHPATDTGIAGTVSRRRCRSLPRASSQGCGRLLLRLSLWRNWPDLSTCFLSSLLDKYGRIGGSRGWTAPSFCPANGVGTPASSATR